VCPKQGCPHFTGFIVLYGETNAFAWQIYELAKETVYLLLDFNPEAQGLLDWVIDRCYTGQKEVADGCFNALAAVFQTK
jgi:hypothetical protein